MHRWIVSLFVIAGLAQTASACSVPVFRYALEHWQPDPFMVAVFHQGELTAEQQAFVQKLEAAGEDGTPIANIMVKAIDVGSETAPGLLHLWELQETDMLPWIAVHAPARTGPPQRIIAGELNAELVVQLLQSPARGDVARRLIAGDSVVWVLVESGDATADDAAFVMLTDELARLQTTLRLPEIEEADFGELSVVPESLRLAFSAIRISRDDPAESAFIHMLQHIDAGPTDTDTPTGPMAFPLFGRGRVLYSLSGERLERQSVEDACRFLTGACQCTVKAENPGLDLLFSIDWEDQIESAIPIDDSEPPLVGLGGFANSNAASQADKSGDSGENADSASVSMHEESLIPEMSPILGGTTIDAATGVAAGQRRPDDSDNSSEGIKSLRRRLLLMGLLIFCAIGSATFVKIYSSR